MDRKRIGLIFVLSLLLIGLYSPLQAQPGPNGPGDDDRPPMMGQDDDRPPMMGQGPDRGPQGMGNRRGKPGNFKNDPEMMKMMQQRDAINAMAEAHKELSRIYEAQNKIDESAAELKKILELFTNMAKDDTREVEPGRPNPVLRKLMPVYHEISRLYLKNNRLDDAEKIMLEGIAKFENDDPQMSSKLILELAEIYRENNKLEKAEEVLKKVIEINQKTLKK